MHVTWASMSASEDMKTDENYKEIAQVWRRAWWQNPLLTIEVKLQQTFLFFKVVKEAYRKLKISQKIYLAVNLFLKKNGNKFSALYELVPYHYFLSFVHWNCPFFRRIPCPEMQADKFTAKRLEISKRFYKERKWKVQIWTFILLG